MFRASGYCGEIAKLLERIEVTDEAGMPMPLDQGADRAVELVLAVRAASRKVMLVGNGGSSAIASHMHNDLSNTVEVRALVFHETPLLTALSNDHGYPEAFERPVALWASPGDLLLAISSSGRSLNILRSVEAACRKGCRVVTFSGFAPDNPLRGKGEINFYAPSYHYGQVELAHSILTHCLTDLATVRRREDLGRAQSPLEPAGPVAAVDNRASDLLPVTQKVSAAQENLSLPLEMAEDELELKQDASSSSD